MTPTMRIPGQQDVWLQHRDPALRQWREEEQVTRGVWQSPDCVPKSPWPGSEIVLPEDLRRAARGQLTLREACQTLALYQQEQAGAAVDLLEREIWAATVLLAASGPIWGRVGRPTLRFTLHRTAETVPCHLEVGYFSHLAALVTPSAAEQALAGAATPCWARVYPHQERQRAGQIGAAAYSYVPIPPSEAVATLGFGRILKEIDAATLAAGQAIFSRAQEQAARHQRLQRVEQMLGWGCESVDATPERRTLSRANQVLALLARSGSRLALGVVFLGLVMAVLSFFVGLPGLLLPLLFIGPALFFWYWASAAYLDAIIMK
jgi:hypothetical protein